MVLVTPMPKTNENIDIEWKKCRMSLLYYLCNYVKVQDRIEQAVVRWKPWPHLVQLVRLVEIWQAREPKQPCFVVAFKSRQVGASTTISAIANWLVTFFENVKVTLQSETQDVASELLDRNRFINGQHPDFLKQRLMPNQFDELGFPVTSSKIITLASTESKGRSTDITMAFCDEWERNKEAREGFAAIKPALDRGGLFIGASTIDKTDMQSFPKEIWEGAKSGTNGFIPLFWDYFVVPGRTEETYQRDIRGLPDWQKEAEYPRNEQEAFRAPKVTGFFNHETLEKMLGECRNPVETRYGGLLRIWAGPVVNRRFVLAIDSSQGMDDPSVGIVVDSQVNEDVAAFHGKISLDEQAKLAWELYQEYNHPLVCVERNAGGLTLIEKLSNLGVTNWYYSDTQKTKKGWYTGSHGQARLYMLKELSESVHLRRKRIPIKDCVLEMFNFCWINGRPEAVKGRHDDWVMCEAIAEQARKKVPLSFGRVHTFKYG